MLPSTEHSNPHSAKLFRHMFYFKCVTDQPRATVYIGLIHTLNALLDWHQNIEEYCEVSINYECVFVFLLLGFLFQFTNTIFSIISHTRSSYESGVAKKCLAAAVPFWTWIHLTSLWKGGLPPLQQQRSFSLAARIQSGCFVCWVYIGAGGRLEECRRSSYKRKKNKKNKISRLHCLPSPCHFAEENTSSIKVKYSLFLLPSHPLLRQELLPPTATSSLRATLWFF